MMIDHDRPTSTQELPTASVEGFAKFIMEDREGVFSASHLHTVFVMKQVEMIEQGILPGKEGLTSEEIKYYQGMTYGVADITSQSLGIDESNEWTINFDKQSDVELFIEEVTDQFKQVLKGKLQEGGK